MRFTIVLYGAILATLSAGLVIPSDELEARNLGPRDVSVDNSAYSTVFRREPRTSHEKKARISAARPAKQQAKDNWRAKNQAAAKSLGQTTQVPGRKSKFHVAAGPGPDKPAHTYTGKDVRKAIFDGHMGLHEVRPLKKAFNKNLSKAKAKKAILKEEEARHLKPFTNYPHRAPMPGGGARPLPHMTVDINKKHAPKGLELRLPNHHDPGVTSPARVILQQTRKGHYTFKGVIAHDQSRPKPPPGMIKGSAYMDHFMVKEHKPRKPAPKTSR